MSSSTQVGLRIARVHSALYSRALCGAQASSLLIPRADPQLSSSQRRRMLHTSQRRHAPTPEPTKPEAASPPPPPPPQTPQPPLESKPLYQQYTPSAASPPQPPTATEPSSTLNPPATTLPPPLEVPAREPGSSLLPHLFAVGKAYLKFYKTGLWQIFQNRRLLQALPPTRFPTPGSPELTQTTAMAPTRADVLLRQRTRHDLVRLPMFGLLLLVCGEFTPLVVLAFPHLAPMTCRIPAQVAKLRRQAEARRARSARRLGQGVVDEAGVLRLADSHIARSLGLTSSAWDVVGMDAPWAKSRAEKAVRCIVEDDEMIRVGGGASELVDEEVKLACEDRGMDVLAKEVADLRSQLDEWLEKSGVSGSDSTVKEDSVRRLLVGLGKI